MQELRGQGAFACWQALRDARADLEDDVPAGFRECVDWAKRQFHSFFQVRYEYIEMYTIFVMIEIVVVYLYVFSLKVG